MSAGVADVDALPSNECTAHVPRSFPSLAPLSVNHGRDEASSLRPRSGVVEECAQSHRFGGLAGRPPS